MENRESIDLTAEEARYIVYDDSEDYRVIQTRVDGEWRHGVCMETIVQRESVGKYFSISWRDSPKDSMDFGDMNDDLGMVEVFKVIKHIEVFE